MLYDLLNSQNKKKKMIPILLYHILYLLSTRSFNWAAQNIKKDRVVTLSPGSICTRIVVPSEQFICQGVAHLLYCGLILYITTSLLPLWCPTINFVFDLSTHPALICQGRIRTYGASESPMRI